MNLRFLDPEKDLPLYEEAWCWQFEKPRWWRELFDIWQEKKEEFLKNRFRETRADIGVFDDREKFVALISLDAAAAGIFEAHFECRRGTSPELLTDAIISAKEHVLGNGAREIFIFVAAPNRPLLKICENCGFERTNIRILYGEFRGAPVAWEQLRVRN